MRYKMMAYGFFSRAKNDICEQIWHYLKTVWKMYNTIDDLVLRKLSNRAAGGTSFGENSSSGSRTYGREVRTHLLRNLDPVGAGEQIASTRSVSLVFLDLNRIFIVLSFNLLSVMRGFNNGRTFKTFHNYFVYIFLYLRCAYFAVVATALFDMGTLH